MNCSLRFLFLADRKGTQCGLLRWHICSTSALISDMSAFLGCNQWPLTASITKRTSTHWTGSLFQATLSSPEMAVWEKPSTSAVSDILKTACLAQTSTPHSKSLQSSVFPILMLSLNFIRSSRSLVYMP